MSDADIGEGADRGDGGLVDPGGVGEEREGGMRNLSTKSAEQLPHGFAGAGKAFRQDRRDDTRMMRLDKYGILVDKDGKCYVAGVVSKRRNRDDKDVEEEYIGNPTYHSGLGEAIKNIRKRMHMDALKKYDGELDGALDVIAKTDAKFDRILAKIEPPKEA